MNLALNGIESMSTAGELRLATLIDEDSYVLRVEDSGSGISDEIRARIFEPFFTTKPSGTGLGLPAVLGIVEQHRGRIDVVGLEKGTRFEVRLPLASEHPLPANAHVLVVEDDPSVREVMRRLCIELGVRCTCVGGVEEALALTREVTFDALLVDWELEDGTAFELHEALKARDPTHPPFIVASGQGSDLQLEQMMRDCTALYLGKPFGLRELRDALIRVLID